MQEAWVWFLGQEDPLEKEMTNHSSILAWKILWIEEPDRLQSMASQRVVSDWARKHKQGILANTDSREVCFWRKHMCELTKETLKAFWWKGETCAPSRGRSWIKLFSGRPVPGVGRAVDSSRLRIQYTESQINHINGHELEHLSRLNIREFWASSRRWWKTGERGTAVHGVTKNRTQLRDWTTTSHIKDFYL